MIRILLHHTSDLSIINGFRRSSLSLTKIKRLYSTIQLRDYQLEAIDKVKKALANGKRRPAVVLATGGGKTVVFANLIPQIKAQPGQGEMTLVLAHREELVRQAASLISECNPGMKVEIDMRNLRPSFTGDVIVASVPTLMNNIRLSKYDPSDFKSIVVDECHHAPANSWKRVLKHFGADASSSKVNLIGFTATMERSDGASLGVLFDEIVYERDLLKMIQNKELVDMKFSTINVDVDFKKVKMKNDDYDVISLSETMNNSDINLITASSYIQLRKQFGFKSTLVFCVDINHCMTMCGILQREGINAQYVTGVTSKFERREIIQDFKDGIIEVLCNVQVFTEGTDLPNIDSLFLARPTRSRPLLVQMIGRGLRLCEGKSHCHVVDIAGTRGTGIQSVPILFCLPPDYSTEGKNYQELMVEKQIYEEDARAKSDKEKAELESIRREEERRIHRRIQGIQNKKEELNMKITTVEGFVVLEENERKAYQNDSTILNEFHRSHLSWIRLEYNVWGCQCTLSDFLLVKRMRNEPRELVSFELTLNRFTSNKQKAASNFKCGNYMRFSNPLSGEHLGEILRKAESLHSSMTTHYFKNFSGSSPVTAKQLSFLYPRLLSKTRQLYDLTPDLENKLKMGMQKVSKERASAIIFAFKFSQRSLWIRWELKRFLGANKKMVARIRHISENSTFEEV